jgi:GNAT superfamily N-acetyltransferase
LKGADVELLLDAYEPGVLPTHHDLFGSYFAAQDKLLHESYLHWLYGENPHGNALMVRCVEGGKWIAFLAMIPVRLARRGQQQLAYYVVNVLVHPEHQGRHLFGRLISEALKHCRSVDAWLMGHPNAMALPSWRRARMQFRPSLDLRPVCPGMPWGWGRSIRLDSRAELQSHLGTCPVPDGWQAASSCWKPVCDAAYLAWRFLEHPIQQYQIRCVQGRQTLLCVTRRMKPGLHLLIEAWSPSGDLRGLGLGTPLFTLAALSQQAQQASGGSVPDIRLRKTLPFFCTTFSTQVSDDYLSALSLATSDF